MDYGLKTKTLLVLPIILIAVIFQVHKAGFEPGNHGWVSSHGLAISARATLENGFVGYSSHQLEEEKEIFDYFDRYPVIFSAVSNLLLTPFHHDFAHWIIAARYLMLMIYFLNIYFAFRILGFFNLSFCRKLGLVLLVFSGSYFVHYKDMFHFDQPAILGNLILGWAIGEYYFNHRRSLLFGVSCVAVLLGRGYSSIFLLFTLWFIESFIKNKENKFQATFVHSLKTTPFKAMCVTIFISTLCLCYNLYWETKLNKTSLLNTSILTSAQRRLGLKEEQKIKWGNFIAEQIVRQGNLLTPMTLTFFIPPNFENRLKKHLSRIPKLFFLIFLFIVLLKNYKKFLVSQSKLQKYFWATLVIFGYIWCFFMRHLTAHHEYTTIYYFGVSLLVFYIVTLAVPEEKEKKFLLLCFLFFFCSHATNYYYHKMISESIKHQASDFQNIREVLGAAHNQRVYIDFPTRGIVSGAPYARDFYLFEHIISKYQKDADYCISLAKNPQTTLTPNNTTYFLYRRP